MRAPDPETRSTRPRVLLVTHHYAPENVAPARRWDALVERLTADGFEFGVLAPPPHLPGDQSAPPVPDRPGTVTRGAHGERLVRTRYRPASRGLVSRSSDQAVVALSSIPLGLRHFRRRGVRPDVVVATVPGIPSMFPAWVLARCLRAKLVVEMRDAWPDLIRPSGMLGGVSRLGLRRALRTVATRGAHWVVSHLQARADLVVTTTETFAIVLRSRGQRWVEVVRNGTTDAMAAVVPAFTSAVPVVSPSGRQAPLGPTTSDRVGSDRPLRAVYLGTMGRSQSLDAVVRAAAEVAQRGHKLEVRMVGRGSEVTALRRLAEQLEAPVTVEDPVSHADAIALYRGADTAIVALHDWGPFEWTIPSKVYEVMARGIPMTAALSGEAAQLVRALEAGSVVPPDDVAALADLWSSWCEAGAVPQVGSRPGNWVRKNATWDVLAEKYGRVLDELAAA